MNLKQKLLKKLKKSGGFTLIEMLIVVAIIAILVAISIPVVSSSLDKARKATDDANERAAKAAALIQYMSDDNNQSGDATYYYDAAEGKAKTQATGITPYGQTKDRKNSIVVVKFNSEGEVVQVEWLPPASTAGAGG